MVEVLEEDHPVQSGLESEELVLGGTYVGGGQGAVGGRRGGGGWRVKVAYPDEPLVETAQGSVDDGFGEETLVVGANDVGVG